MKQRLHALVAGSALTLGAALIFLATSTPAASAKPGWISTWRSIYPNSMTDDNVVMGTGNDCQVCHSRLSGGDGYNPYGWQIRQNMNTMSLSASIQAAGPLDSDGDLGSATNVTEISADTQPGWVDGANNTYYFKNGSTQTNRTPPTIAGKLDPHSVAASETVRLGTPPNPLAFMPGTTGPPILGTTWKPVVQSFLPGAFADFVAVNPGPPLNVPTGLGTLLCTPPSGSLLFIGATGVPFSVPIPAVVAFAGASVCSQGGSIAAGPTIRLANALDLVLGTY